MNKKAKAVTEVIPSDAELAELLEAHLADEGLLDSVEIKAEVAAYSIDDLRAWFAKTSAKKDHLKSVKDSIRDDDTVVDLIPATATLDGRIPLVGYAPILNAESQASKKVKRMQKEFRGDDKRSAGKIKDAARRESLKGVILRASKKHGGFDSPLIRRFVDLAMRRFIEEDQRSDTHSLNYYESLSVGSFSSLLTNTARRLTKSQAREADEVLSEVREIEGWELYPHEMVGDVWTATTMEALAKPDPTGKDRGYDGGGSDPFDWG
jgi:hypothetical protein